MICPKCGYETTGNFCSNCGAFLKGGNSPAARDDTYRQNTGRQSSQGRRVRAWAPDREESSGGENAGQTEIDARTPVNRPVRAGEAEPDAAAGRFYETPDRELQERTPARTAYARERERMETREERRESLKKKEKPKKTTGKDSGKKAVSKDSGKSGPSKKEVRLEQKEKKLRDGRIRDLESEVERLTVQERLRERRRREDGGTRENVQNGNSDSGPDLREIAAKGAAGAVVIASRTMQIISCLLMGCMVLVMAPSFIAHGDGLGSLETLVSERNYGLALYTGFAGVSLFMGVVWCLWILSRKGAGGGFRLKKYDTGRGLIPFLLCAAMAFAVGPALTVMPPVTGVVESWQGIVAGGRAALTAVDVHRGILLFCSGAGAVLSLIRRILLV